jgi:hypothetical protein
VIKRFDPKHATVRDPGYPELVMAGTTPHVERDTLMAGTPGAVHAIDVSAPA